MKREKRMRFLRNGVMGIVLVTAVGWVGYSAVNSYIESRPRDSVEVDYTAVSDYLNGLDAEAE